MTRDEHSQLLVNFTTQYGRTCFGFASHYDTTFQHDLAPSVLQNAVTVVMLRHPVDRFISEFQHTKNVLFRSNVTINYVLDNYHGFNLANHMTLQLAGE